MKEKTLFAMARGNSGQVLYHRYSYRIATRKSLASNIAVICSARNLPHAYYRRLNPRLRKPH
jgi:hypothetical protein